MQFTRGDVFQIVICLIVLWTGIASPWAHRWPWIPMTVVVGIEGYVVASVLSRRRKSGLTDLSLASIACTAIVLVAATLWLVLMEVMK